MVAAWWRRQVGDAGVDGRFGIEVRNVKEARLTRSWLRRAVTGALLAAAAVLMTGSGEAQRATAVPKLDLERYMGVWFEIAQYPIKKQKDCRGSQRVLYALGNKPRTFQMGTFCELSVGGSNEWDAQGKLGKTGDGRLRLRRLWLLHREYWVLALGPAYEWALVGTPNHKSLWVLSRKAQMDPQMLAEIEDRAKAQGFDTAKLSMVAHR